MPGKTRLLTVRIDAQLATDYRIAYVGAFGEQGANHQSLAEFITGFVEDRLVEELEFADREARHETR